MRSQRAQKTKAEVGLHAIGPKGRAREEGELMSSGGSGLRKEGGGERAFWAVPKNLRPAKV